MNPYQELARELRAAGVDEEAIYGVLLDHANDRGDDHAEVFEVLYGDLPPSEAL